MKHTKPFAEFLNEKSGDTFTTPVKNDTAHNFKVYEEILVRYPYMKEIIEESFKIGSPDYSLHDISNSSKNIVFYFDRSCGVNFKNQNKNLSKYNVRLQVPGNAEYSFSISINKK